MARRWSLGSLLLVFIILLVIYKFSTWLLSGAGYRSQEELSFTDFVNRDARSRRGALCEELLFTNTPASDFKMSATYTAMKPAFDDVVKWAGYAYGLGEGHSGDSVGQTRALHFLASRPEVRTVCETGYNAGHSAFNYLTANPRLIIHSFDIGWHQYTPRSAQNLSLLFPGRLFLHMGDSRQTVPNFISENPDFRCNMMIVDGGHNYESAKSDMENFASIADLANNVIIMDDYPAPTTNGPAWDEAIKKGYVEEMFSCGLSHTSGFAVGKVVRR